MVTSVLLERELQHWNELSGRLGIRPTRGGAELPGRSGGSEPGQELTGRSGGWVWTPGARAARGLVMDGGGRAGEGAARPTSGVRARIRAARPAHARPTAGERAARPRLRAAPRQGHTLVHFSAQPKPFWSHLPVSPCLIDWGKIMHHTYPTKCAYVEPKSGRV